MGPEIEELFSIVPVAVTTDEHLTSNAIRVYVYLAAFWRPKQPRITVGLRIIASHTHMGIDTVRRAIDMLAGRKHVVVVKTRSSATSRRHRNAYFLQSPVFKSREP